MKWDELLRNTDSEVYKSLATLTETNIREALQQLGPVIAKVVRFSSDGDMLKVTCAVMWHPNIAIDKSKIKEQLVNNIRHNNGKLHNQFRVDTKSVTVEKVVKNCRSLGCKQSDCEFSFKYLKFFCWCDEETLHRVDCVLRNSSRANDQQHNDLMVKQILEDSIKQSPADNAAAENIEVSELDTDDGRDNHEVATDSEVELEKMFTEAEGSGLVTDEEFIAHANNDIDNLENELFIMDSEDPEHVFISDVLDEEELTTLAVDILDDHQSEAMCLKTIERHQLCDNLIDCDNGDDEVGCEFGHCQESEFSCLSGRCIPLSWKCDGKPDCDSGEDEVACVSSCPEDQFKCGEGRCIAASLLCDGVADCGQADDEAGSVCKCEAGQYQCQLGGGCVRGQQRCDGQYQCPDRSDEWNCINIDNNTLQVRDGSDEWSAVCADNWTSDWSHNICSHLGFTSLKTGANFTKKSHEDHHYWILNSTSNMSPELIQTFRSEDTQCSSNSSIQLTCDSFGEIRL